MILVVALVATVSVIGAVIDATAARSHGVAPTGHDVARRMAPAVTAVLPSPSTTATVPAPTTVPPTEPPPTIVAASTAPTTVLPIKGAPVTRAPVTRAPVTTAPVRFAPTAPPAPAIAPAVSESVPVANLDPSPDFLTVCSSASYDDSFWCVEATLAAIDNARQVEGLNAMTLPTNWASLTPAEQLFVATDLERTARGLQPVSAMAGALDAEATQAAQAYSDPSPPTGFPWTRWGGNWAGQIGNPLEAVYYWMYDDGMGSSNQTCSTSDPTGCWVHRKNVLLPLSCAPCVMGVGWATPAQGTSLTEILVDTEGSPATDLSWAQEQAYLP